MTPSTTAKTPLEGLASLVRNDRGTVAVITAVAIVPLILSMGLAVDVTRAYMMRAKLSAALDAAGLAVGANPNMSSSAAAALAQQYINSNLGTSGSNSPTPTITQTSTTVTVSATAQYTTGFMGLAGVSTLPISASSTISFAQKQGVEVAMVLDNTGSLNSTDSSTGQTNISALKTAAGHLVTTLVSPTTASNTAVRVGIVPFVAAVNPGSVASSMLQNPPTLTASDPTGWTGCVIERSSTFPLSTLSTLKYTDVAKDLDTPVSAANGNYLTQYFWPQTGHPSSLDWSYAPVPSWSHAIATGPFTSGNSGPGPNQSCPTPVVPLTNQLTPLLASIGADTSGNGITNQGMEGWNNGGTNGAIGMSWGYRMLSPNGPYKAAGETVSGWNDPLWQKVVVLMTDGVNNINSNTGTVCDSNGKNCVSNKTVQDYTGAPGTPPTVPQVDQEEELVCDALRANGVVIYSVLFNSTIQTNTAITYCPGTTPGNAKGSASPYFFQASNQAALYQAFSSIAKSLSNLRVSK